MRKFSLLVVWAVIAANCLHAQLIWTEAGSSRIRSGSPVGGPPVDIVNYAWGVSGVAFDYYSGNVYWTIRGSSNLIQSTHVTGGPMKTLVSDGLRGAFGMSIDCSGKKVYWADELNGSIQRSDLDGNNVENVVVGLSGPEFLALDNVNKKVYWTNVSSGSVQSANFDGSGLVTLYTGLGVLEGIALDVNSGYMFLAGAGSGTIIKAKMDGSFASPIVSGLANPIGITIDSSGGKLYWVDQSRGTLESSNFDGSGVATVYSGLASPRSVTFIPTIEQISFSDWINRLPIMFRMPDLDPDNDGICNLLEYVFGFDPLLNEGVTVPSGQLLQGSYLNVPDQGNPYFCMRVRLRANLFGLRVIPEATESLSKPFDQNNVRSMFPPVVIGGYSYSVFYYQIPVADISGNRIFMRLRVY